MVEMIRNAPSRRGSYIVEAVVLTAIVAIFFWGLYSFFNYQSKAARSFSVQDAVSDLAEEAETSLFDPAFAFLPAGDYAFYWERPSHSGGVRVPAQAFVAPALEGERTYVEGKYLDRSGSPVKFDGKTRVGTYKRIVTVRDSVYPF